MLLGIAGNRYFEGRDCLDAAREIGGIDVAAGSRGVAGADAAGGIAAERHDMAHADVPIVADDRVDLFPRRVNACQMSCWLELRLLQHARDGCVRALAGRAAGAVGDRDEGGIERLEPPDRAPQGFFHGRGPRREELERHVDVAMAEEPALAVGGNSITQRTPLCASFSRGEWPAWSRPTARR